MRATSIQLYSRTSRDDAGEPAYCGCYAIPYEESREGHDTMQELANLGLGLAREEDGTITRASFFADEIDAMIAQAELVTECDTETPWEYGYGGQL